MAGKDIAEPARYRLAMNATELPRDNSMSDITWSRMVKYFMITGIMAAVTSLILALYCLITYLEKKREMQLNRMSHAVGHVFWQTTPKQSDSGSSKQRYSLPIIMRAGSKGT